VELSTGVTLMEESETEVSGRRSGSLGTKSVGLRYPGPCPEPVVWCGWVVRPDGKRVAVERCKGRAGDPVDWPTHGGLRRVPSARYYTQARRFQRREAPMTMQPASGPLERLRHLAPVLLVLGALALLWETAFGRHGTGLARDLLRGPALGVLLLLAWLLVVGSPLWLLLGVAFLVHGRRWARRTPA